MSAPLTKNPLSRAISFSLSGNAGVRVLDYGDKRVFEGLWGAGLQANSYSGYTYLLLCGVNPPAEAFDFLKQPGVPPVDVSAHFTAYSWAAAFRLINPVATLNIVILDSGSALPRGAGADLQRLFNQDNSRTSGVACIGTPDLQRIVDVFRSPKPKPLDIGMQGMMRGLIQQHLIPNPEDHHKLGNIVGALMLTPEQSSGRSVLGSLFQALQPATKFDPVSNLPSCDEALKAALNTGPHVVLFDDMAEMWASFVRQWVPAEKLHVVRVGAADRTRLVKRLRALTSEPIQKRQLLATDFGVAANQLPDGFPFIVLLDLRLFAGDQTDDEVEFLDELKALAPEVARADALKWPAISDDELQEVQEAWYLKHPYSPAYRKARSWLPRLISLIDPTLPIVTFSSTQDPEVLRPFQAHGNIVTNFAKPMFRGVLGETKDWMTAAILAFESALRAALSISSGRAKLTALASAWLPAAGQNGPRGGKSQVEIFIDESGTADEARFAIGAVVLISGQNPFDHGKYRTEALNSHRPGGLWGLDDIVTITRKNQFPEDWKCLPKGNQVRSHTETPAEAEAKNHLLNEQLSGVDRLVQGHGATLFVCSILSVERPDMRNVASVRHPYHRYRDLLGRLLEAILFHCEPVVQALEGGAKLCVDAATAKNTASKWLPDSLANNFGAKIEVENSIQKCRPLYYGDVLPIVTGLLLRNGREAWTQKLLRARGVQLTDFASCTTDTLARRLNPNDLNSRRDPKPLHYLADWIAHFTYDERDWSQVPRVPVLKNWFEVGFRQQDGDVLQNALRSHRRWAQHARVGAINSAPTQVQNEPFALVPKMQAKAAKWLGSGSLTNKELCSLFFNG
jgi:hypothetical protein